MRPKLGRTEHLDDGEAGARLQLLGALLLGNASGVEHPLGASATAVDAAAARAAAAGTRGHVTRQRVRPDPGQQRRAPDRQPDQSVQDADDGDRSDEEEERRRLEGVRQVAVRADVARRRLGDVATGRVLQPRQRRSSSCRHTRNSRSTKCTLHNCLEWYK